MLDFSCFSAFSYHGLQVPLGQERVRVAAAVAVVVTVTVAIAERL